MSRATYYRLSFETRDLQNLIRACATISMELERTVLPVVAMRRGDRWLYMLGILFGLRRSKQILLTLWTLSDTEPKNFIRYNDSPKEELELRMDMMNPVGAYIPVLRVRSWPEPLVSGMFEKELAGYRVTIKDFDDVTLVSTVRVASLEDLVRIAIEREDAWSLVFHVPDEKLWFTICGVLEAGDHDRLYVHWWRGEREVRGPYLTINDKGKVVGHVGRIEPIYSYASLIELKSIGQKAWLEVFRG